ncbi:MAG: YicC family protein [Clostridia bacterium]|nr:YicC family protein [Clostridia bacterium]
MNSMTAFGRARQTRAGKDITVEIRAVNNRYLDVGVRTPRAYAFLEEKIKPYLLASGISRGKVEVGISIDTVETPGVTVALDEAYAASYIAALEQLRDRFGLRDDISVTRVAANRDIFTVRAPEENLEEDWAAVSAVLDEAIAAFLAGRAAEGARLAADLRAKLAAIGEIVDRIEVLSAADIAAYHDRLLGRLQAVLSEQGVHIEESRVLTECAIFADRVAIDEELVRLRSHFAAFEEIAASSEPAGRKLDFLMQEMNREINTVGSKCSNAEIAHLVVEVKSELEKIREQIQNLE